MTSQNELTSVAKQNTQKLSQAVSDLLKARNTQGSNAIVSKIVHKNLCSLKNLGPCSNSIRKKQRIDMNKVIGTSLRALGNNQP